MKPSGSDAASSKLRSGRLVRDRAALPDAGVLGVRARASCDAEDLVADRELGHGRADRLDLAGELHPGDPPPRAGAARRRARHEERLGAAEAAVGAVDRRRVDPDEDLVVLGNGPLDLLEPQHLGRPVPVADDRLSRCDHHLGPGVALAHVAEGVRDLAQLVPPVDDRRQLPGLEQLAQASRGPAC